MHVVITGGTGLIGTHVRDHLESRGDDVTVVSRSPGGDDTIVWDPKSPGSLDLPDETDAVVHLAGASIYGKRWTEAYKREILESRKLGTETVVRAVRDHGEVDTLVSGSAVGYYGDRGEDEITEEDGPGDDFLAGVCQEWEDAVNPVEDDEDLGTDVVRIRTGIVLSREGGALDEMLNPFGPVKPFHWGLGGPIGSGKQWFPWVHVDDHARAVLQLLDEDVSGPFNLVGPEPARNKEFVQAIGDILGRPTKIPMPKLGLRAILGEAAEFLYISQKVRPQRLRKTGFTFEHPPIEEALEDLLAGGE
jgi:uncharacterized protein (TIGR01777 family)